MNSDTDMGVSDMEEQTAFFDEALKDLSPYELQVKVGTFSHLEILSPRLLGRCYLRTNCLQMSFTGH